MTSTYEVPKSTTRGAEPYYDDDDDHHQHESFSRSYKTYSPYRATRSSKYRPPNQAESMEIPPRAPTPPNAADLPRPGDRDFAVWIEDRNCFVFPYGEYREQRRRHKEPETHYYATGYHYRYVPKPQAPLRHPYEDLKGSWGNRDGAREERTDGLRDWERPSPLEEETRRRRRKEEEQWETARLRDKMEEIRLERKIREREERLMGGERDKERKRKGDREGRRYRWR
ncbi:hypothetical protein QBC35DRAFT_475453 [Podospora australis]|uniref:Uncharacterized protein n=1 Tax=Podospora australis TaxID=1536484 RepID=A0AAN6WQQ4_9PEZI|nr:hypothetical protein QBC35DRAFT_475453 [Podospora australis]